MASENDKKRVFFIQLETEYFSSKIQKALRKMPGGSDMVIAYLKMQLKYANTNGKIEYLGLYNDLAEEIAEDIEESHETLKLLLAFLNKTGLITENNRLIEVEMRTKSHTLGAEKRAERRLAEMTNSGQTADNVRQNKELRTKNKELDNKKKINKKEKTFDDVLNQISNQDLVNSFKEFIKMRKALKKPLTTYALELAIKKLRDMSEDENIQIKIIEQTISNGWLTFYPFKEEKNTKSNQDNSMDLIKRLYEESKEEEANAIN